MSTTPLNHEEEDGSIQDDTSLPDSQDDATITDSAAEPISADAAPPSLAKRSASTTIHVGSS